MGSEINNNRFKVLHTVKIILDVLDDLNGCCYLQFVR